jgi:crossover junction endodeoxyribonuclease RuvC
MRVLGIDPGTITAGWGVIEKTGSRLRLVAYGTVSPGRRGSYPDRLKNIYDGLTQVIRKYAPDFVALEEAFYGKNIKAAIRIGEGRAIALLCAARAGLPVAEYAARVVKKSAVGVGTAHKTQVQQMVKAVLGLKTAPEPEDAADALAIALCHCNRTSLA